MVDGIIEDVGPIADLRARYPDAEASGGASFKITPGFVTPIVMSD